MSERGGYRAIHTVLLDGKDFRRLDSVSRWVFVALKLNFGPAGIDVWYRDELVARLSGQTGCSPDQINGALVQLEAEGWVAFEDNIVWVIGHITHDPHMDAKDTKHRKSVQKHLAGLPRMGLVRAFIIQHPEWVPPSEGPSMGLQWAFEAPELEKTEPETPLRTREPETESEPERKPEPEPERISTTTGRDALLNRFDSSAQRSVITTFLDQLPASENEFGWIQRVSGWIDGIGIQRAASPDDVCAGLSEYVTKQDRDFSPIHVTSYIQTATRKRLRDAQRQASDEAQPQRQQEAERIWEICKTHGLLHTTAATIDSDLKQLVDRGVITNAQEFRSRLKKLDIRFLRTVQSDRAAITSIAEKIAA